MLDAGLPPVGGGGTEPPGGAAGGGNDRAVATAGGGPLVWATFGSVALDGEEEGIVNEVLLQGLDSRNDHRSIRDQKHTITYVDHSGLRAACGCRSPWFAPPLRRCPSGFSSSTARPLGSPIIWAYQGSAFGLHHVPTIGAPLPPRCTRRASSAFPHGPLTLRPSDGFAHSGQSR